MSWRRSWRHCRAVIRTSATLFYDDLFYLLRLSYCLEEYRKDNREAIIVSERLSGDFHRQHAPDAYLNP